MTAQTAIAQSIQTTEIVRIAADADAELYLRLHCDDSAESDDLIEFWGTTDEGKEWRVHMHGDTHLSTGQHH